MMEKSRRFALEKTRASTARCDNRMQLHCKILKLHEIFNAGEGAGPTRSQPLYPLDWICNPDAVNISIYNAIVADYKS